MGRQTFRWPVIALILVLVAAGAALYIALGRQESGVGTASGPATRTVSKNTFRKADATIQAELGRIRAAGHPVSATTLALPRVPDPQNAALLYQQAYAAVKLDIDDIHTLERLFRPPLDPEHAAAPSRAILARNRRTIGLIYEAVDRPECRFDVNWDGDYPETLPHLSVVARIAWLMPGAAVINSLDGDVPGALRAVRAGVRLGDAVAEEPCHISQMARYVIFRSTLEGLQVVLASHGHIPADLAKPLHDALGAVQITEPFTRGLIGDRAWALSHYQDTQAAAGDSPRDLLMPAEWTLEASEWLPLLGERIALSGQPYRLAAKKLDALDKRASKCSRGSNPLARYIFPRDSRWATVPFQNRDTALARIGLAQTALALKAYQAKTGSYPDSLEALRSALGWTIPRDPFSGRDFVYKRDGKDVVFYSIGPDLRDDGGARMRRPGARARAEGPRQGQVRAPAAAPPAERGGGPQASREGSPRTGRTGGAEGRAGEYVGDIAWRLPG